MGRKLNKDTTAAGANDGGALVNVKDRQEAITGAFDKIYAKEKEIDRLTETHIEPHKADRKKLWRDLKADVDIERKDLELMYRIHKRNREAHAMGEDGQRVQDNLRETFFAMQKGGQLDFLDAMQDAA